MTAKKLREIGIAVFVTWAAFFVLFAAPRLITAVRTDVMGIWTAFESAVLFLWIGEYQDLAGGVATLIAAAVGAAALWRDSERKDRARAESLKARLALELSDAVEYATASVGVVRQLIVQLPIIPGVKLRILPDTAVVPALPGLPTQTIERLTELSAFASRGDAERIADILHILQIQWARLQSLEQGVKNQSHIVTSSNLVGCLAEALYLHAAVSELYPWTRRRAPHLAKPIGLDKLGTSSSVLEFAGIYESDAFDLAREIVNSEDPLLF